MKNALLTALLLLVATAASAQQQPTTDELKKQPDPDYSKQKLLRIFVVDAQPPNDLTVDTSQAGGVRVRSRLLNVLFAYLPFFAPLPGSAPTTTRTMIDPFAQTHMQMPYRPGTIRTEGDARTTPTTP